MVEPLAAGHDETPPVPRRRPLDQMMVAMRPAVMSRVPGPLAD